MWSTENTTPNQGFECPFVDFTSVSAGGLQQFEKAAGVSGPWRALPAGRKFSILLLRCRRESLCNCEEIRISDQYQYIEISAVANIQQIVGEFTIPRRIRAAAVPGPCWTRRIAHVIRRGHGT
jgi:hypothetical protein